MKNKLLLLFISVLLLAGCEMEIDKSKVTKIYRDSYLQGINQDKIYFTFDKNPVYTNLFNFYFYDSVGKFKVGQQIKFTK